MATSGAEALLEQLRVEERAALGVDPDGTAYLDASERIERVRAAYRARLAEEEPEAPGSDGRRPVPQPVVAELR